MKQENNEEKSAEELQKEIESLIQQITLLQEDLSPRPVQRYYDPYREENLRIEMYLSEMTSRQGILLTIAGLLTLLPLTTNLLKHFLVWSFPFLTLAIFAYVCSSKRISFVSEESPENFDSQEANKHLKTAFFNSVRFHKIADVAICIFLVSFVLNFYLFTFTEQLDSRISFIVLITGLLCGLLRYWYISQKSPTVIEHLALGGTVNKN